MQPFPLGETSKRCTSRSIVPLPLLVAVNLEYDLDRDILMHLSDGETDVWYSPLYEVPSLKVMRDLRLEVQRPAR